MQNHSSAMKRWKGIWSGRGKKTTHQPSVLPLYWKSSPACGALCYWNFCFLHLQWDKKTKMSLISCLSLCHWSLKIAQCLCRSLGKRSLCSPPSGTLPSPHPTNRPPHTHTHTLSSLSLWPCACSSRRSVLPEPLPMRVRRHEGWDGHLGGKRAPLLSALIDSTARKWNKNIKKREPSQWAWNWD